MTDFKDALETSMAGQCIATDEEAILVPDGFHVEDLGRFHETPRRISTSIEMIEVQSFIKYVNNYRSKGSAKSIIKADVKGQRFTAVLDYHKDGSSAGWQEHKAVYNCPQSREWRQWFENNARKMTQANFAEFIENNQLDIQPLEGEGPSSADMLEVSRNLQANQKVEFKSSINLSNGDVGFEYQATTAGVSGAAKGKIDVPQEFFVVIPVYEGDAAYPIRARLRYRISDGVLALWFELVEPEKVMEDAFRHVLESIEKDVDGSVAIYRARA